MTPQEQQLVTELFARLNQTPAPAKDADADRLIGTGVTENPDAPYLLVQTVLIQDMALQQAQHRVAELENRLAAAQAAPSAQPSPPATSFLGGLFSRGSSAPPGGSWERASPPIAPAAQPSALPGAPPVSVGGTAAPGMLAGAPSGFLRSAAATALGVVGGQMLFQGVQSMFGQHAGSILSGQPMSPALSETVVNNFYGDQAGSPASTGVAHAEASAGDAAVPDTREDVADDDSGQDQADQDGDVADTDDSLDGDDTDVA